MANVMKTTNEWQRERERERMKRREIRERQENCYKLQQSNICLQQLGITKKNVTDSKYNKAGNRTSNLPNMNTFVLQFPWSAMDWYPQQSHPQWARHQISQSLFCCLLGLRHEVKCSRTVYSDRAGFKGHWGWRRTALRLNQYGKWLTIIQKDGK
jgi:hypothetical protein